MKVLNIGTRKVEIIEWLRSNNVSVDESLTTADCYAKWKLLSQNVNGM